MELHKAIEGCLLGTAVGDALGLPFERLTRQRQRKLFGEIEGHRFLFGRGMCSDDTEHTVMVARAVLRSGGDVTRFERSFAWQLRRWILCFPAGLGRATLKSCLKLLSGFPPNRSGIFSAGNGPAMRSALLGILFFEDRAKLEEFVRASTRISHTDPKAEVGALLVALAAGAVANEIDPLPELMKTVEGDDEWSPLLDKLRESLEREESTLDFANEMGLEHGVSGYMLHTVPVALHAALGAPDYKSAVLSCIRCGGDTDTTAAIAGAIAGAKLGVESIPENWIKGYVDYPLSISHLKILANKLAGTPQKSKWEFPNPFYPVRNIVFLITVLVHGFRRLFPPY